MVTPREMREFALECLRWSDETENASQREIMVQLDLDENRLADRPPDHGG